MGASMFADASPAVSVIVPVYNSSRTIRQCFDSLTHQTLDDFEVIAVDDGSRDESTSIVEEYRKGDSRFSLMRQENAGPGAARNVGLDAARGKYVLFVDADDWVDSTLLEKAVSRAEGLCADVVIWDAWLENERTGERCLSARVRIDRCDPSVSRRSNPYILFQSFQNWPWNKLFLRSFLEENDIRFQDDLRHTEDLLFTDKALACARLITGIPEALSHYRIGQNASAMSRTDESPLDFYRALRALRVWLIEQGLYGELRFSYAEWAVVTCMTNLRLFRTHEAYCLAFGFLQSEGLEHLGLLSPENRQLLAPWMREEIAAIKLLDADVYLHRAFSATFRMLEDTEVCAGNRWLACQDADRRIKEACTACAEAESAAKELAESVESYRERLKCEEEALAGNRRELAEIQASYAWRIGRAICWLPAKVRSLFRNTFRR